MKLLTLNVHAWLEANQAEKIEILADTIVETVSYTHLVLRPYMGGLEVICK